MWGSGEGMPRAKSNYKGSFGSLTLQTLAQSIRPDHTDQILPRSDPTNHILLILELRHCSDIKNVRIFL